MEQLKSFAIKNWKNIAFILLIGLLIFTNERQYQQSAKIVAENQKINIQYLESLKREELKNQQIASYKDEIKQKDAVIKSEKANIEKTEAQLKNTQDEAKRLAKIIINRGDKNAPIDVTKYTETCDSLAYIVPVLSDQVDTLKSQNKNLVTTMEQKSALQDSIIQKKDDIIFDKNALLKAAVDANNKATEALVKTENKYNKEKKRKSFWKKLAIGLGVGVAGVILAK